MITHGFGSLSDHSSFEDPIDWGAELTYLLAALLLYYYLTYLITYLLTYLLTNIYLYNIASGDPAAPPLVPRQAARNPTMKALFGYKVIK